MRAYVLILSAVMALSACNTGQVVDFDRMRPEAVRPGLTAAQIETIPRVPNGLRKRWRLSGSQAFEALEPVMDVRLSRKDGEVAWTGNLKFRLPGSNLREIARQLEQATGRKAPIEGDRALVPVAMASDDKGRITRFGFFGNLVTYVPHDCQNVVGDCRSLWRDQEGRTRHVLVQTREEGGRWYAVVRLDPAHNLGSARAIEQRVYSVDRYGLYRDASIIDLESGEPPYFLRGL